MTMDAYQKTLDELFALQKFGIKLGLNSTEKLLDRLDSPHQRVPCLHLAGTNGKGSVGAMVEAAFMQTGVKVAMYTSPHLVRFSERFTIRRVEITEARVVDLARQVLDVVDKREVPTFFEVVTAMGFLYFAQEGVELAILETGLGGRLDATNVCTPLVSLITNIGLEHTEFLGNTLAQVGFEKAGIIKPGVPLVHGVAPGPARRVIEERAAKLSAPVLRRGRELRFRRKANGSFDLSGTHWKLKELSTNLVGLHQPINACLALGACELLVQAGYDLEPLHFETGLKQVNWPGRLEKLPQPAGQPTLWMDGAHNIPAAQALLGSLDLVKEGRSPLVMVLGVMADKDYGRILHILAPAADRVVLTRPQYFRAAEPQALADAMPAGVPYEAEPELARAIERGRELAGAEGVVLISGSLFTVGEARGLLV
jgi:dihydrofolate synthase/folylpolyglutamate synthase